MLWPDTGLPGRGIAVLQVFQNFFVEVTHKSA